MFTPFAYEESENSTGFYFDEDYSVEYVSDDEYAEIMRELGEE